MRNIFIIGSKGIPARYGGFETFVENLVKNMEHQEDLFFHVSCLGTTEKVDYKNVRCFPVRVPNIGSAKAILYDFFSLRLCIKHIKANGFTNSIIYILACRIGPLLPAYLRALKLLGVQVFVNPDGHEWKRAKWNSFIKWYWKLSERYMVSKADLVICDSLVIEDYIKKEYKKFSPATTYISYGAYLSTVENSAEYLKWLHEKQSREYGYYLVVGRFVPENNYEYIIKEFMQSPSKKKLIFITNFEKNKFYHRLYKNTHFYKDERIIFGGTIYDPGLLRRIRQGAYGYIHGHEVGGTNPSLLEALASTRLNMVLDVDFNREVADNGALYFSKEVGSLASLIERAEKFSAEELGDYENRSRETIRPKFSWELICHKYTKLFKN